MPCSCPAALCGFQAGSSGSVPQPQDRSVPQQLLQLSTELGHCSRSLSLSPALAPQQGGAHWGKLKSAGFVGGHLSQHQISAGALCSQLPKKPLLLMSFPPNHEPFNKIHRAALQPTPLTTDPSLLVHMSPFTSAEEWLYVFLFQFIFYDFHLLCLHVVCLCGWCLVFIIFNCISDHLLYGFVHILLFHEILIKHLATELPNWILMFSAANYEAGFKVSSIM